MRIAVYSLCFIIALVCVFLLFRAHRRTNFNLLFWSGLYFVGQLIACALVILDRFVFADVDLYPLRLSINFVSICALLYGLIFMRQED